MRIFHLRNWTDGIASRGNGGKLNKEQVWGRFGRMESNVF